MDKQLLMASSRVGLAGLLHDLGKLAERAGIEASREKLDTHLQLYGRKNEAGGRIWYSHKHAAYTALALDEIEKHIPKLVGSEMTPFSSWGSRDADDSIINAAARHHRPASLLQWIIATADRVASGFEREMFEEYNRAEEPKNHITARQLTLFEQIRLDSKARQSLAYRYPLRPQSVESIFPREKDTVEGRDTDDARREYAQLWESLISGLQDIPESHREDITLWLDHFESLWGVMTQALPSATAFKTKPDVSLYDHSRAVAALAIALWRYHHERGDDPERTMRQMAGRDDWSDDKLLLVQGDLFGIQSFIFATGGETQKRSAKLLRGRSFYVSLLTELAALKILEVLSLPSVSQIINAAGKFLIVAHNTPETVAALSRTQEQLDSWFLEHTYGEAGIGLAWEPAACNDFLSNTTDNPPFGKLVKRLFEKLEAAKSRRFNLCAEDAPGAVFSNFLDQFDSERGACMVDGRSPAREQIDRDTWVSTMAMDQISLGGWLTNQSRMLITRENPDHKTLKLPIFGYYVSFTGDQDRSGSFERLINRDALCRLWDFSLPGEDPSEPLWNGYARRSLNAWIPRFGDANQYELEKYQGIQQEDVEYHPDEPKTLNHIAREAMQLNGDHNWVGVPALMTLKGDVDSLGRIFQQGLKPLTFAKWAALSRQVNAFFSIYLPWLCRRDFPDTYTVFAGGDDFFLIGPWRQTLALAQRLRKEFARYVAHNPELHFSAGLSMTKPGLPVRYLGNIAEEALEAAKEHNPEKMARPSKDAVSCFERTMSWERFERLMERQDRLAELRSRFDLSTRYLYGMIYLAEMAERVNEKPENAIWISRFAYRTQRMLERTKGLTSQQIRDYHAEAADVIAKGIEAYGEDFKVTLFSHLYQNRD